MANLPTKTLSIAHALVGISSLLGPILTQSVFRLDPAPSSALIARLFGSRDLLLGAAVWMARPGGELRRVLHVANFINGIDVASSVVCLLEGSVSVEGGALAGGGAAVLLALGLAGLRGVGGKYAAS